MSLDMGYLFFFDRFQHSQSHVDIQQLVVILPLLAERWYILHHSARNPHSFSHFSLLVSVERSVCLLPSVYPPEITVLVFSPFPNWIVVFAMFLHFESSHIFWILVLCQM